jgi:hypothetical protein
MLKKHEVLLFFLMTLTMDGVARKNTKISNTSRTKALMPQK